MFQKNILLPPSGSKSKPSKKPARSKQQAVGLLFDPEDGGNIFFQNVGLLTRLHDLIPQKTEHFIVTAGRTLN
jgi:hypothetical protein